MKPKTDQCMLSGNMRVNKSAIALLAVVGVAFYLMNVFAPLYVDDWHYCFIFGTTTPIASVADVFASQFRHYFEFNGRVVPHVFVQFFDGLTGKPLFNVVNTAMFLLFLHLVVVNVISDRKLYYKALTLVVAIVLLIMPGFNLSILWLSGACNYLWTSVFLLVFNILLQRDVRLRPCLWPVLACFGLLCGWTNEGLVLGLSAGYLVYYAMSIKELTPVRIALLTGFVLGVLLMLVSPGNFHRAMTGIEGQSFSGIIRTYASALLAMSNLRVFFVLLVALLFVRFYDKEFSKRFVRNNVVWLVAAGVSFIFIVFTKHDSAHSRFGIELFSLIVLLKLCLRIRISTVFFFLWNVALCVFMGFALHACMVNYDEYKSLTAQIQDKSNHIIVTHAVKQNPLFSRFMVPNIDVWPCYKWIANYYNRDTFIFLPAVFVDGIKSNPDLYERFYTSDELPFYAKRLEAGQNVKEVTFLLRKTREDEIPFYLKPFADRMERYSALKIQTNKYRVVEIDGQSYLLVDKLEMVDKRVTDILVD